MQRLLAPHVSRTNVACSVDVVELAARHLPSLPQHVGNVHGGSVGASWRVEHTPVAAPVTGS
jgi:hypothetical protein